MVISYEASELITQLRETVLRLEQEKELLEARCARIEKDREHAWHWATRDSLTGLPSRALFEDRLLLTVKLAERSNRRVAVACMNLDGFKQLNDHYGPAAGDELLIRISRRLQQALREADTVARLGGDEFAMLLEDLDPAVAAGFLRERVHAAACAPVELDATFNGAPVVLRPRMSVGVALFPDHARTANQLLKRADESMRAAKRAGGGVQLDVGPAEAAQE